MLSLWCSSARTPPPYGIRITIGAVKAPCVRVRMRATWLMIWLNAVQMNPLN